MSTVKVLFLVAMLVVPAKFQNPATCETQGPCRCHMTDGSGYIDISSLGNQDGTPRWADVIDDFGRGYSFNPCFDFSIGAEGCDNAAVCQSPMIGGTAYETLGTHDSMEWEFNGYNALLKYRLDGGRGADITVACDPTVEDPTLYALGEIQPGISSFTMFSKCACAGACPNVVPAGSGGEGLTLGSILLIGLAVLLLVYVVVVVTFNRIRRQASGRDMLPHPDFWAALPGLTKDGFVFTWRSLCARGSREGYQNV